MVTFVAAAPPGALWGGECKFSVAAPDEAGARERAQSAASPQVQDEVAARLAFQPKVNQVFAAKVGRLRKPQYAYAVESVRPGAGGLWVVTASVYAFEGEQD